MTDIDKLDKLYRAIGEAGDVVSEGWMTEEWSEAVMLSWEGLVHELRELREENHRLGLIAEEHDCLAFPWDGHAPSRRDKRVERETLERAANAIEKALASGVVHVAFPAILRSLASHDTGGGG